MRKVLLLLIMVGVAHMSYAQRTITGKVVDENSEELPGVNVFIKGTTTGVTTDINGNYSISVPGNDAVLVFSFVGLETKEETVGARSVIDITLNSDVNQLEEVVVTGVSVGTATKKLGFAVGKVNGDKLDNVPANDPATALRGKVAGVKVVQNGGGPGSSPTILLRGATSLSGTNAPLLIVDGIITNNSLQNVLSDINPDDIETVEILKGAAAASIYGSLAGNGAIQIITKRGSGEIGKTNVSIRNSVGFARLPLDRTPELSQSHNDALTNGEFDRTAGGAKIPDPITIVDNPYPVFNDVLEQTLETSVNYTNAVSISSAAEKTNFLLGFENTQQGGFFKEQDPFRRRSVRLNVDHRPVKGLELSATGNYAKSIRPVWPSAGQQANILYAALITEPDVDITEQPTTPFYNTSTNAQNPIYLARNTDNVVTRDRFLGNIGAKYEITDWWRVDANYSLDRINSYGRSFRFKGYLLPDSESDPGFLNVRESIFDKQFLTANSIFTKEFNELNATFAVRYQNETDIVRQTSALVSNFLSVGVPTLGNVPQENINGINSFENKIATERYVGNIVLDFRDTYILDATFSRDGSSLFGGNETWQNFYRVSGAYRITEDIDISAIDEWKIRASYGITGDRPPFQARFETFRVTPSGINPGVLGNENLRPAQVSELELGTNIKFSKLFTFEFNYARTIAEDQWLNVPLSPAFGFRSQFQNVGTIEANTLELALNTNIYRNRDFDISVDLFLDRTFQEVTELGVAPFGINGNLGVAGAAGGLFRETFNEQAIPSQANLFRIEEGVDLGAMFGQQIVTSLDQLNVDGNGLVTNGGANLPLSDFSVNRDGFVIVTANRNTPAETVFFVEDENGIAVNTEIGNANPDLNFGFSTTVRYKNFNFYFLLDGQLGGDVYNATLQNLTFNRRSALVDQSGLAEGDRKYNEYYQSIYNLNRATSFFVEDATFMKLRELSIGYTFGGSFFDKLGGFGDAFSSAKFALTGRNLLIFSDYSGFDPEVATANSAPIFRYDEYTLPQPRSIEASLTLNF